MMYEKCTLGYLTKRKKAEILWIVFFVVLGVAILLTGYLWSGVPYLDLVLVFLRNFLDQTKQF